MRAAPAQMLALCCAAASLRAFGLSDTGTTAADFLKLGSGARSEAMGEAYVAVSDDTDALSYNPAGPAQDLAGELSATHSAWFEGLSYDTLAALIPDSRGGAWGAGFSYLSTPPIPRTFLTGGGSQPYGYVQDGTFSPYDMVASLDYAHPLGGGFLGGAGFKLINESLDTQGAFDFAADLGTLWQAPVPGLTLGASMQNLGPPMRFGASAAPLPFVARGGAAYRTAGGALLFSAEGDLPYDAAPAAEAGAEWNVADRFFPRVGWRYDGQFNPWSLGFGLRYGDWGLDLSAVPYGPLGLTYRGTLGWTFGGPGAVLEALTADLSTVGTGSPAELEVRMSAPYRVDTWAVSIFKPGHPADLVRTLSGFGPPKGPVAWDGRDAAGGTEPAGTYWAVASVRYQGGRRIHSRYARLTLVDAPPEAALALDPSSVDPYARADAYVPTEFRPSLLSGGAVRSWSLVILDGSGRPFRTLTGTGPLPASVVWDGSGDGGGEFISASRYAARLSVADAFGDSAVSRAVAFTAVFR